MIAFPDLKQHLPTTQAGGAVFTIQCVPDPFTQERLNIGVCVIDGKGKRRVKTVTEPGRLECLYGDAASVVVSMAGVAADCALRGLPSPSDQLIFGAAMPFYNAAPEDVLESTFRDQVTVALPRREESGRVKLTDEDALKSVIDAVKERFGLHTEYLASTPNVFIETEGGTRALHIPLQPRNGVGIIRSADYAASTLKMHLFESVLDLECAARSRQKPQMGLFVLRPHGQPEKQAQATDGVLDTLGWKASRANLRFEVSEDEGALAEMIAEWAD